MREGFGEKFDVPAGYLNTAAILLPFARVADTLVDMIAQWRAGALQLADFDADVVAARNAAQCVDTAGWGRPIRGGHRGQRVAADRARRRQRAGLFARWSPLVHMSG